MIEHTPGPWRWAKMRTQQALHDDLGSCFAGVIMPMPKKGGGAWSDPGYRQQMEANARLIAAAPDLLEAAQDIIKQIRKGPHIDESQLLAAIAKATRP